MQKIILYYISVQYCFTMWPVSLTFPIIKLLVYQSTRHCTLYTICQNCTATKDTIIASKYRNGNSGVEASSYTISACSYEVAGRKISLYSVCLGLLDPLPDVLLLVLPS